jgi:hypothetical protein
MGKRTGRPAIEDLPALRRVAEHLAEMEEKGRPCSVRAAILQTAIGKVAGNSGSAVLWRLQRKWRQCGQDLLADARERRAAARRAAAYTGTPGGIGEVARLAALGHTREVQEMLRDISRAQEEFQRTQDLIRRTFEPYASELQRTQQMLRDLFPAQDLQQMLRDAQELRRAQQQMLRELFPDQELLRMQQSLRDIARDLMGGGYLPKTRP